MNCHSASRAVSESVSLGELEAENLRWCVDKECTLLLLTAQALAVLRMIPTSGKLYIDDVAVDSINLDALRTHVTIIPQDPVCR